MIASDCQNDQRRGPLLERLELAPFVEAIPGLQSLGKPPRERR